MYRTGITLIENPINTISRLAVRRNLAFETEPTSTAIRLASMPFHTIARVRIVIATASV